jgi:hypothetical protein
MFFEEHLGTVTITDVMFNKSELRNGFETSSFCAGRIGEHRTAVVWWLALLFHIQKILSSNLHQETKYSD